MCELCDEDEKKREAGQDRMNYQAELLESIAGSFREMASGRLKPHSKQATDVGRKTTYAIRFLVADWL